MICYRCQEEIASRPVRVRDFDAPFMTTTYYCRHCYKAITTKKPSITKVD